MLYPKVVVTRQMVRDANERLIARSSSSTAPALHPGNAQYPVVLTRDMINRAGRIALGSLKRG